MSRTCVELLEDRRLLSSVSFDNGILSVIGNDSSTNNITVDLSSDNSRIVATINGSTTGSAPVGSVNTIRIMGGDEGDKIIVDSSVTNDAYINGRSGSDSIVGGGGDDTILSFAGFDTITGGAGDDSIDGGVGDDRVDGGTGDDTITGGLGTDSLNGGSGVNVIDGNTSDDGGGSTPTTPPPSGGSSGGSDGTTTITDTPGLGTGSTDAEITLLDTSITAGQTIFVNALKSSLASGTAMTAKFEWDFGDAGSEYNTLNGFSAGHIYNDPGNYQITLKLTDEDGGSATATANVTVAADNRRTIYVSNSGDDSNDGSSPSEAIQSLNRLKSLQENLDSNFRILFNRGDSWDTTAAAITLGRLSLQSNIDIGAYGSGAQPVLRFTGADQSQIIQMLSGKAKDISIHDITLDSKYGPNGNIADSLDANAIHTAGQNITISNCTFLNVDTAIVNSTNPVGVMVQDNSVPLATGMRANFVWGQGSDYVILGNKVANSTREHILRFAGTDRVLIAYNDLTNLDRRSVDGKDYNKKVIVLQNGTWAYIDDNKFSDGPLDVSTDTTVNSTAGTVSRGALSRFHWVVVERNEFSDNTINLEPNAWHVAIRDNVFETGIPAIHSTGVDLDYTQRVVNDVIVTRNTVTNRSQNGALFFGEDGGHNISLTKNVFFQPTLDRPINVRVYADDLSMFSKIDDNVWMSASNNYIGPVASKAGYKSPSVWNSYAQVGDDIFTGFSLGNGFQVTVGGVTAGANM